MYYVVVNRHKVQANRRNNTDVPVLRISRGKYGRPKYANSCDFPAGARLVQDGEHPLPCGATVWIEAKEVA